jgi:hypothetical protein
MGPDAVFGNLVGPMKKLLLTAEARACVRAGLILLLSVIVSRPALAQIDLSGSWGARNHEDALERGGGPYAVDYAGLPLTPEGLAKALAYSESQLSMIERQCTGWPQFYLALGPFGMKIWNETDPISGATIAWTIGAWEDRAPMAIWMDGRPRPSAGALHPRSGFTTGTWEGETLVAYTTHMKAGAIRRNGAPSSDRATMTTRFIRHGDLLTLLIVVEDPVYLSEPYIVSKNFQLGGNPISPVGPPCVAGFEGASGVTPHYLPGRNPSVGELTTLYGIPREGVLGGAEGLYPEYRKKLKVSFVRPEKCLRNCGGPPR